MLLLWTDGFGEQMNCYKYVCRAFILPSAIFILPSTITESIALPFSFHKCKHICTAEATQHRPHLLIFSFLTRQMCDHFPISLVPIFSLYSPSPTRDKG